MVWVNLLQSDKIREMLYPCIPSSESISSDEVCFYLGGGCEILPSLIMMMCLVAGVAYCSLISLNMHHTLLESNFR